MGTEREVATPRQLRRVAVASVLGTGLGVSCGPRAALCAERFEPRYRYSGASSAYAVGAVVSGGSAPLIATALPSATR